MRFMIDRSPVGDQNIRPPIRKSSDFRIPIRASRSVNKMGSFSPGNFEGFPYGWISSLPTRFWLGGNLLQRFVVVASTLARFGGPPGWRTVQATARGASNAQN
jgi:hypothetical protein